MSQQPHAVRYSMKLLRAGEFRLDGGSMFGLIPRVVWSRTAPTDDKGRIAVQHNCLLLARLDDPPHGSKLPSPKLVLIETGTGNKLDPKNRDIFALSERWIGTALDEAACRPEDIGGVVVSHLHFDHAGGLTRLCREGEKPDWAGHASSFGGPRPDQGVKRTFPNAKVFAQAREWADANADRSVMTRTYFQDHLAPVADQFVGVESARPFAPGLIPERDESPRAGVDLRETEIMPGIFVFLTPGHTWGQQAVRFTDAKGRQVVFTPDVMPTAWHVGAAYNLAYDVEPYTSMVTRRWFLGEAAARKWTLCLDHEAGNPFRTVKENGKGWFELEEAGE
jgi:glyoxylase-like metal-dependent hydrolase (beta-lactamase superfamily II)